MNILAIGAHPDDIEIGCGGSLIKHIQQGDTVRMLVLTSGQHEDKENPKPLGIRCIEAQHASQIMGVDQVECWGYPDTQIPESTELIARIENIVSEFNPDRVYIPYGRDTHQDHRATSNVAKSACRNVKQILEYEEPTSYNSFNATYWIDISDFIDRKLEAIKAHVSQGDKQITKLKSIEGLNLYRGYQSHVEHAEGFVTFRFLEQ